ncbi:hypothetical protein DFQ28_000992 [Apophysomyces sp. BC1034]|nr:hypothetical protein DFQ28_000992 [Apophysomyces sp. BC1034]
MQSSAKDSWCLGESGNNPCRRSERSPEKCDYEIIFYEQPNPKRLQFLALDPLQLDISSKPSEPTTDQAVLANLQIMIDYGHRMMGQASRSDDLSAVLVQKCTVESLESMMLWFLETPAGLKLNRELASFLSELFLWLIRLWTAAYDVSGGLHFKMFSHDDFLLTHHYYRHHLQRLRARLRQLWKDKAARTRRKSVRFRIPALLPARDINGSPSSADSGRNGAYLWMRNMPIPFSAIFFQYMLLWKRLSAHYFSAYVLRCLLYGEPIKPIPKLQYPMLPEKRPSLETAWKVLKSNLWDA